MSSENTLTGSTALVTGATSGIGRAIALRLAAAGAEVVLHGRSLERGAALVDEIVGQGGRARFVAADLTDADEALRLASEAGEVDILVNNAGVYEFAATPATDAAAFDKHIAINTRTPFLLVGALAPGMAGRGSGSIITITSNVARITLPVGGAYAASKAGAETLTRYWASEFGGQGVRVNAISPGAVLTEGTLPMFGDNAEAMGKAVNARGKLGEPEEIADIVLFLASPNSSYINGAVLAADGGDLAVFPG
ncbi:SDR family NAD(P)-dependent oxidoreductase [Streptomyces sp. A012304]|uniref:SDR family NAD(P)-dependent oxidoreductase n=1 Tax=Streptomyces sp. A012304 TaxID=375446 RepID=UPI00222F1278|nr:SDR family oxidoreductase [Streptomyces sp. A012304]GKQ40656.1 dehydrogenase [Streptomyces sp. A012304]